MGMLYRQTEGATGSAHYFLRLKRSLSNAAPSLSDDPAEPRCHPSIIAGMWFYRSYAQRTSGVLLGFERRERIGRRPPLLTCEYIPGRPLFQPKSLDSDYYDAILIRTDISRKEKRAAFNRMLETTMGRGWGFNVKSIRPLQRPPIHRPAHIRANYQHR